VEGRKNLHWRVPKPLFTMTPLFSTALIVLVKLEVFNVTSCGSSCLYPLEWCLIGELCRTCVVYYSILFVWSTTFPCWSGASMTAFKDLLPS
jgi:hypothetical protein